MNHFGNNLGSNDFNSILDNGFNLSLPNIENSFEPTNLDDPSNPLDLSPSVQLAPQPFLQSPTNVNTSVNNDLNNDSVFSFDNVNNLDVQHTSVNPNLNNFNGNSDLITTNDMQQQITTNQQQQQQQRIILQQQQQLQHQRMLLHQQQMNMYNNSYVNGYNSINSINLNNTTGLSGWNSNPMVQQYPMLNTRNSMSPMNCNYQMNGMNPLTNNTSVMDPNQNLFNTCRTNNITRGIDNMNLDSHNYVPDNRLNNNNNDNRSQITTSETSVDIEFDIKTETSSFDNIFDNTPIQTHDIKMRNNNIQSNFGNGISINNLPTNNIRKIRPKKRKQVPIDGRTDSQNKRVKTSSISNQRKKSTTTKKKSPITHTIPDEKLNINLNEAELAVFGIAISFIVVYNNKLPAFYLEKALKSIAEHQWGIENPLLVECEISKEADVPEPLKPKKPKKGRPRKIKLNTKYNDSKDIVCVNKSFKYHSKKETWNRLSCIINIQDLLSQKEFLDSHNIGKISCDKLLKEKLIEDIIKDIENDLKSKSTLMNLLKHVLQPFDIRIENDIAFQKMVCVREIDATKLEEVAQREKKRRVSKTERERTRREKNKNEKNVRKSRKKVKNTDSMIIS